MGTPLWLAYTPYNNATMLLSRQDDGDTPKARELLASALGTTKACGLTALRAKIDAAMKR
jgi:hypothetical protein